MDFLIPLFLLTSLALFIWSFWIKFISGPGGFRRFAETDGQPDYMHAGLESRIFALGLNTGGIAINKKLRKIYFRRGMLHKSYSFDDIRQFSTRDVSSGRVVGFGLAAGMAAMGENRAAASKAMDASGLFVGVKDIDNAEWQIQMPKDQQKRWNEIMTQFVLEEDPTKWTAST